KVDGGATNEPPIEVVVPSARTTNAWCEPSTPTVSAPPSPTDDAAASERGDVAAGTWTQAAKSEPTTSEGASSRLPMRRRRTQGSIRRGGGIRHLHISHSDMKRLAKNSPEWATRSM